MLMDATAPAKKFKKPTTKYDYVKRDAIMIVLREIQDTLPIIVKEKLPLATSGFCRTRKTFFGMPYGTPIIARNILTWVALRSKELQKLELKTWDYSYGTMIYRMHGSVEHNGYYAFSSVAALLSPSMRNDRDRELMRNIIYNLFAVPQDLNGISLIDMKITAMLNYMTSYYNPDDAVLVFIAAN